MTIPRLAAVGLIALTSLANAQKTAEPSLTSVQKILIANKMVDLHTVLKKGFRTGRDFQMKSVKQFTGTTKFMERWERVFLRSDTQ